MGIFLHLAQWIFFSSRFGFRLYRGAVKIIRRRELSERCSPRLTFDVERPPSVEPYI